MSKIAEITHSPREPKTKRMTLTFALLENKISPFDENGLVESLPQLYYQCFSEDVHNAEDSIEKITRLRDKFQELTLRFPPSEEDLPTKLFKERVFSDQFKYGVQIDDEWIVMSNLTGLLSCPENLYMIRDLEERTEPDIKSLNKLTSSADPFSQAYYLGNYRYPTEMEKQDLINLWRKETYFYALKDIISKFSFEQEDYRKAIHRLWNVLNQFVQSFNTH